MLSNSEIITSDSQNQQQNTRPLTISSLLAKTVLKFNSENILFELSKEEFSLLKTELLSTNSQNRKMASIVILFLSSKNPNIRREFEERRLIFTHKNYTSLSLNLNFELEDPEDILEILKQDEKFLKDDLKCNRFFIKCVKKDSKRRRNVHIITLTEMKFYLREEKFKLLPDPLTYAMWFYKEKDIEDEKSKSDFSPEIEKMIKDKIEIERIKNNYFEEKAKESTKEPLNEHRRRLQRGKRKTKSFKVKKKRSIWEEMKSEIEVSDKSDKFNQKIERFERRSSLNKKINFTSTFDTIQSTKRIPLNFNSPIENRLKFLIQKNISKLKKSNIKMPKFKSPKATQSYKKSINTPEIKRKTLLQEEKSVSKNFFLLKQNEDNKKNRSRSNIKVLNLKKGKVNDSRDASKNKFRISIPSIVNYNIDIPKTREFFPRNESSLKRKSPNIASPGKSFFLKRGRKAKNRNLLENYRRKD